MHYESMLLLLQLVFLVQGEKIWLKKESHKETEWDTA